MKSRLTLFTAFIVLLLLSSCGPRSARTERRAQGYSIPEGVDVACSADTVSVLDRLPVGDEPYRLCPQVLTSEDGMDSAFPERPKEFLDESTPTGETFYFPAADIRDKDIARTAQLRYNCVSLYNRVIHSYEWYVRMAINIAEEDFTRKDTLYWIRYSQPSVSRALIDRDFAQDQYDKMKEYFCKTRPFDGIREYLGWDPTFRFDVDAGPVAFGLSPSGTAWAIGPATFFMDREYRRRWLRTGEIAGVTVCSRRKRHYLLGSIVLVGEAVTLAMKTNCDHE